MRHARGARVASVVLAIVLLKGCGGEDLSPPDVLDAEFIDAFGSGSVVPLGIADSRIPLDNDLVETGTSGTITLIFNELLDADTVQEVVKTSSGDVIDLVGREGIIRVAPADGSRVQVTTSYRPERRAIYVTTKTLDPVTGLYNRTYLPASTDVLVHLLADRVRDAHGNLTPAARLPSGEAVRDSDGREIAATVALTTQPLRVRGTDVTQLAVDGLIPQPDDPTTPIDEEVAISVFFNTAVAAESADGRMNLTTIATGTPVPVMVEPGAAPEIIHVIPTAALTPETTYELRVRAGITDTFGMPLPGESLIFAFTTPTSP